LVEPAEPFLELADRCAQRLETDHVGVVDDSQGAMGRDRLPDSGHGRLRERAVECDHEEVLLEAQLVAELDGQVEISERAVDGPLVQHYAPQLTSNVRPLTCATVTRCGSLRQRSRRSRSPPQSATPSSTSAR